MKYKFVLLIIIFLCSCKSLPIIQPLDAVSAAHDKKSCSNLFPEGNWQFIHSIEATMPNKKKAFIIGITDISSASRKLDVVMMTIEGLVLFNAEYDHELKIKKAISPFDSKEFASGLVEDIKLIFFKPVGTIEKTGYLKDGSRVWRYRDEKGFVIDVEFKKENTCEIRKYNNYHKIIRLVKTSSIFKKEFKSKDGISQTIELIATGKSKYSLILDLIGSKKLKD